MKLFTKGIDSKLFAQYKKGSDLENQMVVAKIFNPYGRGKWYLINSDPSNPDYIWAIVDMFEIEVGSVSRSELEGVRVPPFGFPLERDLYFSPVNALELLKGIQSGVRYKKGGVMNMASPKYKNGGNIKWQDVEIGDSALVKETNRLGVIIQAYGRKFHLKFPDGTEKTYDANELMFLSENQYENGGDVKIGDEPPIIRQVFEDTEELDYAKGGGVGEIKFEELVGNKFSIERGSGTKTTTWEKEDLLEEIKGVIKHELFDREFYYNWTNEGAEYYNIFDKYTLTPMLKDIDKTLNEYFVMKKTPYDNILEFKEHSKIQSIKELGQGYIDNWFKTNPHISAMLRNDYKKYREKYAGVTPYAKGGGVGKAQWILMVRGNSPESDEGYWENYHLISHEDVFPTSGRYEGYKWVEMSIKDGVPEGFWEKIEMREGGGVGKANGNKEDYEVYQFLFYDIEDKEETQEILTPDEAKQKIKEWNKRYRTKYKDWEEFNSQEDYYRFVAIMIKKAKKAKSGGVATFDDKVKAISNRLVGTKVKPKYRKEYGATYDKKEAKEAATKIAGKMRAKEILAKRKKH